MEDVTGAFGDCWRLGLQVNTFFAGMQVFGVENREICCRTCFDAHKGRKGAKSESSEPNHLSLGKESYNQAQKYYYCMDLWSKKTTALWDSGRARKSLPTYWDSSSFPLHLYCCVTSVLRSAIKPTYWNVERYVYKCLI